MRIQNSDYMTKLRAEQFKTESNSWKRSLAFIVEENVRLKNRLADLLKSKSERLMLESAENYQSRFIKTDELISLLRNEVVEFDKMLSTETGWNEKMLTLFEVKLNRIRGNVLLAENDFGKLKAGFNSYFSENIQ